MICKGVFWMFKLIKEERKQLHIHGFSFQTLTSREASKIPQILLSVQGRTDKDLNICICI